MTTTERKNFIDYVVLATLHQVHSCMTSDQFIDKIGVKTAALLDLNDLTREQFDLVKTSITETIGNLNLIARIEEMQREVDSPGYIVEPCEICGSTINAECAQNHPNI